MDCVAPPLRGATQSISVLEQNLGRKVSPDFEIRTDLFVYLTKRLVVMLGAVHVDGGGSELKPHPGVRA